MANDDRIVLMAPVSGVLLPLAELPGDVDAPGIAIDPTSQQLVAPCGGAVGQVVGSGQMVTLRHSSGLQVVLRVGDGQATSGFHARVQAGQTVQVGEPLVDFDADSVALAGQSLVTRLRLHPPERVADVVGPAARQVTPQDVVLKVHLTREAILSPELVVHYPSGLHARPAAVLAATARRFAGDVELLRGDDRANAKSVVSLMTLQVQAGDKVRLKIEGDGAESALQLLMSSLAGGLGEDHEAEPVAAPHPTFLATDKDDGSGLLHGLPTSPGLAVGRIFRVRRPVRTLAPEGDDPTTERRRLRHALDTATADLKRLERRLAFEAEEAEVAIFSAHRLLLEDPDLTEPVWQAIDTGLAAAYAWQKACEAQAERLASLQDARLASHASDVWDVGERVLRLLVGEPSGPLEVPPDSVVVAEDLTPSETATLDRSRVVGLATLQGGTASHSAILARLLELPALAALGARGAHLQDGVWAILDGTRGTLQLAPTEAEMDTVRQRRQDMGQRRQRALVDSAKPAVTLDGRAIEVNANLGNPSETDTAVRMGAEGVGLLRSEFLFLGRSEAPSEDEQADMYLTLAQALGPLRRLIVRTLDIGAERPQSYLPMAVEANPFLGERGVRLTLQHPDLMRQQFRAILKVADQTRLGVMLPMVTNVEEFLQARAWFEEERARLHAPPVPLGIMIEVPAAALTASALARVADFFALGTNHLTRYTLAVDRGHARLSTMADGLHPSVLRLIKRVVEAAHAHDRWVGVCGGMAGDPQAIPILLGLGVDKLTVAVPSLAAVKSAIRELDTGICQDMAARALDLGSALQVRDLVETR